MTPLTPELIERVRVLRASGLSLSQIGAQVGRPKTTVQNIVARLAAVPPPKPATPPWYADSPGPGACSWPLSEGRPWRFCPVPREAGGVYCPAHRKQATGGRSWHAEAA